MANHEKTIGLDAIQIISPYELVILTDLRINRKPNYHTQAYFSAVIPEEKKDSYVEKAIIGDKIEINQVEKGQMVRALLKGWLLRSKSRPSGTYIIWKWRLYPAPMSWTLSLKNALFKMNG